MTCVACEASFHPPISPFSSFEPVSLFDSSRFGHLAFSFGAADEITHLGGNADILGVVGKGRALGDVLGGAFHFCSQPGRTSSRDRIEIRSAGGQDELSLGFPESRDRVRLRNALLVPLRTPTAYFKTAAIGVIERCVLHPFARQPLFERLTVLEILMAGIDSGLLP